jgi:hypothetical protein
MPAWVAPARRSHEFMLPDRHPADAWFVGKFYLFSSVIAVDITGWR